MLTGHQSSIYGLSTHIFQTRFFCTSLTFDAL